MEEHSATKYTQLSSRIFVPEEWPVRGIELFLLKLAKTVIEVGTFDKLIVLQVQNIATVLVRNVESHEARYYFEKIANPLLIDAYVIDVVLGASADLMSGTNSVEPEDSSDARISLDSYVITTHQSENRTAYYFLSPDEYVLTLDPEKETDCGAQQNSACRARRWATTCDVLLVLAAIIIASLVYVIVLKIIR